MNLTITQIIILARTFADELEAINCSTVENTAAQPEPTKRTRGPNKPKETPAPAQEEPAQPAEPANEQLPETGVMQLEDLKALIDKPVKAGIGKQVKDLIAKHGGTKLADLPPAAHEAFKADVEALVY